MEIILGANLQAISHTHTMRSESPLHAHNVRQDIDVFMNVAMDNAC